MDWERGKRWSRWVSFAVLAGISLTSGGCVAAAVTAGVLGAGAAGYVYYQGAVPRDYPADMDQTWAAAQLALADLGMPIVSAQRGNHEATIESRTGDGDAVKITLEPRAARVPADGNWTHVLVRVALIGDGPLSERVLNQIESRLAPPGQPGWRVPVTVGPPTQQTDPPPPAASK